MLFTADQFVAHAVGDYILQSDWMADNKAKNSVAAAIHAATYTVPFVFLTHSWQALAVICGTHFLIDRYRLSRFVNWLKNGPFAYQRLVVEGDDDDAEGIPTRYEWGWHLKPVTATGYPETKPPFIATWLNIITDNIMHVICNALALTAFGGMF